MRYHRYLVVPVLFFVVVFSLAGCTIYRQQAYTAVCEAETALKKARKIVLIAGDIDDLDEWNRIDGTIKPLRMGWKSMPYQDVIDRAELASERSERLFGKMRIKMIRRLGRMIEREDSPKRKERLVGLLSMLRENESFNPEPVISSLIQEEKILTMKTAFRIGHHSLTREGKRELKNFIREEIDFFINETPIWLSCASNVAYTIFVDVKGYADSVPFNEESKVYFKNRCEGAIDTSSVIAERKSMNKCLSSLRSESIKKYMEQLFEEKKAIQNIPCIEVKITSQGKGEELPPGYKLVNPSLVEDENRRICIITCRFEAR